MCVWPARTHRDRSEPLARTVRSCYVRVVACACVCENIGGMPFGLAGGVAYKAGNLLSTGEM